MDQDEVFNDEPDPLTIEGQWELIEVQKYMEEKERLTINDFEIDWLHEPVDKTDRTPEEVADLIRYKQIRLQAINEYLRFESLWDEIVKIEKVRKFLEGG